MTHRERVFATLNHRPPDRVPVDLGATRSTFIVVQAHEGRNRYLGWTELPLNACVSCASGGYWAFPS
jgi:hypothetical protein